MVSVLEQNLTNLWDYLVTGNKIYVESGPPDPALGNPGDLYIDDSTVYPSTTVVAYYMYDKQDVGWVVKLPLRLPATVSVNNGLEEVLGIVGLGGTLDRATSININNEGLSYADIGGPGIVYTTDLTGTFVNESLITKRYVDTLGLEVADNTTARHTHANKALLDTYTQTEANLASAVSLKHNSVTIGTANGLSLATQALSLGLASAGVTGALLGSDWTSFNNKVSSQWTGTTNISFTGGTVTASNGLIVGGTITLNSVAYTFPGTAGTNGYSLVTNGSGTLSWVNVGGGGGGSVTSVTAGLGLTQTGVSTINPTINVTSHAGSAGTIGTMAIASDTLGINLGASSTTAFRGDYGDVAYNHVSANGSSHLWVGQDLRTSATVQFTTIRATGEITAFYVSDKRLKTDIKNFKALDILDKINIKTFKWNDRAKQLNKFKSDTIQYGVIAQELEEVLPELVHSIYDKYKGVDYTQLNIISIQAIKELKQEVNKLKEQLNGIS